MRLRTVLAVNLRKLRAQKKLSQESLAALADINRNYVGMLEREQFSATIDIIEKLADALDVEPTTLLTPGSSS
ncbi:XRE family transcriptional regulator [Methylorubrum populi]|jgi:transcriptional regulator with XRE-family HTH domain|nr:helix-turn-helix transcriptional regulator [Methylorubrum populi]OAH36490.1 XRE family transcriptional regulator [Methylorubrum populi]